MNFMSIISETAAKMLKKGGDSNLQNFALAKLAMLEANEAKKKRKYKPSQKYYIEAAGACHNLVLCGELAFLKSFD